MKKILFRADAKPSIGIGDLMSLIHLSEYFRKDGWQTHFIIRGYEAAINLVQKYEVKNTHIISADIDVETEVQQINYFCDKLSVDVLFFEISERKLSEYVGLSKKCIKIAASFDGFLPDGISLILNWAPSASDMFNDNVYSNAEKLLGMEYVILPYRFLNDPRIKQRIYSKAPNKILISMGGADEFDFTSRVLMSLSRFGNNLDIRVVVGSGYLFLEELRRFISKIKLKCEIFHNVTNMLEFYLWCDIGIGAGGLTSSELVATRTPSILIAMYEHQIERCEEYDRMGLASFLGYRDFDATKFASLIKRPVIPAVAFEFKTQAIVDRVDALIQKDNRL